MSVLKVPWCLQVYECFRDTWHIDFGPSGHWSPVTVRGKPKILCFSILVVFHSVIVLLSMILLNRTNHKPPQELPAKLPGALYHFLQGWVSKRFLFWRTRIFPEFIQLPSCSSENCLQNQPLATFPLKWKKLWVLSEPSLMVEVMCAIEYVSK